VSSATTEWDQLVAAARQEKTLTIATYAGTGFRKTMDSFQDAFPGIQVEHSQFQSASRDFMPRLLAENQAGLYAWDVSTMPPHETLSSAKRANAIEPIRSSIIRPELLQDSTWWDGFEAAFNDPELKWGFAICRYREGQLWINTDVVKDGEITKFADLLDPKWKGKITGGDPRTKGSAYDPITAVRLNLGRDDIVEQFYKGQEVTVSTDARQLTESMVRGRYPIGLGAVDQVILADFQSQGLGNNLKRLPLPEIDYLNSGAQNMWLMTKAPHPNVAKLFINWVLTKEGSEIYSKNVGYNSRRADVAPVDPESAPLKGVKYVRIDLESLLDEIQKTEDISKEVLN